MKSLRPPIDGVFYVMEIWKDIPGYEGLYQASDLGRVKSLKRIINHSHLNCKVVRKEKVLKPTFDSKKYHHLKLTINAISKTFKVHKLIAMTFLNHKTDGTTRLVIDHINNIRIDNRLENLQIITNRENCSKDRKSMYSDYTGVSFNKRRNKFIAYINLNGKLKHLGYFLNDIDASKAYQDKLREITSTLVID